MLSPKLEEWQSWILEGMGCLFMVFEVTWRLLGKEERLKGLTHVNSAKHLAPGTHFVNDSNGEMRMTQDRAGGEGGDRPGVMG